MDTATVWVTEVILKEIINSILVLFALKMACSFSGKSCKNSFYGVVVPQAPQTHDSRNWSNINNLCTRIEWDMTAFSAQCYVMAQGWTLLLQKTGTARPFWIRLQKGTNWLSLFASEGKNRAADSKLCEKMALRSSLLDQQCPALTSSIETCDKHLKHPPPNPKTIK